MPRVLEKNDLLGSVVEASPLEKFWLDTIHPLNGHAEISVPEDLFGYDIQVVYIPIARKPKTESAKDRLHALMARTPRMPGEPYSFKRSDAYDEERA